MLMVILTPIRTKDFSSTLVYLADHHPNFRDNHFSFYINATTKKH